MEQKGCLKAILPAAFLLVFFSNVFSLACSGVSDFGAQYSQAQGFSTGSLATIDSFVEIKSGTILEIVLHPATGGYVDDEAKTRQADLQLVLDPDIKKAVEDNNVCLIGYRELRDFQRKRRVQRDAVK